MYFRSSKLKVKSLLEPGEVSSPYHPPTVTDEAKFPPQHRRNTF